MMMVLDVTSGIGWMGAVVVRMVLLVDGCLLKNLQRKAEQAKQRKKLSIVLMLKKATAVCCCTELNAQQNR